MAHNEIRVDTPADVVFGVLADPRLYAVWVVGASAIRKVDGTWPTPGARFHHTQGGVLRDITVVLDADPPWHLRLEARALPLIVTIVDLRVRRDGDVTMVEIDERITGGAARALPDRLGDALVHARNAIGIRRLKALAEIALAQGLAHDNTEPAS